jgi:hypothetical protein
MRTFVLTLITVAGLNGLAVAQAQAMPAAPHHLSAAAPAVTEVRQRCGKGMHRQNGWQDKHGA